MTGSTQQLIQATCSCGATWSIEIPNTSSMGITETRHWLDLHLRCIPSLTQVTAEPVKIRLPRLTADEELLEALQAVDQERHRHRERMKYLEGTVDSLKDQFEILSARMDGIVEKHSSSSTALRPDAPTANQAETQASLVPPGTQASSNSLPFMLGDSPDEDGTSGETLPTLSETPSSPMNSMSKLLDGVIGPADRNLSPSDLRRIIRT